MASVVTIFSSTYHTKQLNPWPTSPASNVAIYSHLSACPGKMEPFKRSPTIHGYLTSLRNKPQQKQSGPVSAPILDWIVSQCVQLSCDGESVSFYCVGVSHLEGFHKDSNIICSFYIIYMHGTSLWCHQERHHTEKMLKTCYTTDEICQIKVVWSNSSMKVVDRYVTTQLSV